MPAGNTYRKQFLYIAGACGIYLLFKGISFVNDLQLNFKSIRLGGSFFYPEAFATFTIKNPTNIAVTVDSVTGNVSFKNQNLASVSTNQSVQIAPYQSIDIEIKLLASIGDLLQVVKGAIASGYKNQFYFNGIITSNGLRIPVKTNLA